MKPYKALPLAAIGAATLGLYLTFHEPERLSERPVQIHETAAPVRIPVANSESHSTDYPVREHLVPSRIPEERIGPSSTPPRPEDTAVYLLNALEHDRRCRAIEQLLGSDKLVALLENRENALPYAHVLQRKLDLSDSQRTLLKDYTLEAGERLARAHESGDKGADASFRQEINSFLTASVLDWNQLQAYRSLCDD